MTFELRFHKLNRARLERWQKQLLDMLLYQQGILWCVKQTKKWTEHRAKPAEKHLRLQLGLVFLEWLWKESYEFPLESISSIVSICFCSSKFYGHRYKDLGGGFKYFKYAPPTWGNDPIWPICFKWLKNHQLEMHQFRCLASLPFKVSLKLRCCTNLLMQQSQRIDKTTTWKSALLGSARKLGLMAWINYGLFHLLIDGVGGVLTHLLTFY